MSYALISDDMLLQLEHANISRSARLLHIEAIVYCSTALTDGQLTVRLGRMSDADDTEALADELVTAGLWSPEGTGYRITDYLKQQRSRDEVLSAKAASREKQERSRRHRNGDHSMCIEGWYCPEGQVPPKSKTRKKSSDTTGHVTGDTHGDETTPIRSDSDPKEEEEEEGSNAATEPEGSTPALPPDQLHDYFDAGGSCARCGLPKVNRRHPR